MMDETHTATTENTMTARNLTILANDTFTADLMGATRTVKVKLTTTRKARKGFRMHVEVYEVSDGMELFRGFARELENKAFGALCDARAWSAHEGGNRFAENYHVDGTNWSQAGLEVLFAVN